jgi:mannose-6-phosphate isomerase-like protein (cupin superfamily)
MVRKRFLLNFAWKEVLSCLVTPTRMSRQDIWYPVIRLSIGEDTFDVEPGDSWCIPGNVEHGAEVLENAVAVEAFSPVREDYLPDKPV